MEENSVYTISLALEDYVPVILFSVGLFLLSKMIAKMDERSGRLAYLATILITLGGLFKASWKLILAATGTEVAWLQDILFVLLTPGFIFLTWAIFSAQQERRAPESIWVWPLILSLSSLVAAYYISVRIEGRSWVFMLMGVTTIFNVAVSSLVIRQSLQQNMRAIGLLFLLNIVLVFVLGGIAFSPEPQLRTGWIEQLTNTISTGAFAFAAWKLGNKVRGGLENA